MNARLAKTNFDYCEETRKLKHDLELHYIELGARLKKIDEEKLYEPNFDSFSEYLDDLGIDRSTASKLMAIWTRLVVGFCIRPKVIVDAGGWSKVAELLPVANTKDTSIEWLEKSAVLSKRDLRKEVKEFITGIPMMSCPHREVETITFCRCLKCGETMRKYEEVEPDK